MVDSKTLLLMTEQEALPHGFNTGTTEADYKKNAVAGKTLGHAGVYYSVLQPGRGPPEYWETACGAAEAASPDWKAPEDACNFLSLNEDL